MKKVQLFAAALVAVALTACNAPAEEADAATDAETTEVEAPATDEADDPRGRWGRKAGSDVLPEAHAQQGLPRPSQLLLNLEHRDML